MVIVSSRGFFNFFYINLKMSKIWVFCDRVYNIAAFFIFLHPEIYPTYLNLFIFCWYIANTISKYFYIPINNPYSGYMNNTSSYIYGHVRIWFHSDICSCFVMYGKLWSAYVGIILPMVCVICYFQPVCIFGTQEIKIILITKIAKFWKLERFDYFRNYKKYLLK